MTERTESSAETASREATDWLILLQEDPDDPDIRHRFNAWLASDPMHEAAWAETQDAADAIEAILPGFVDRYGPFVNELRGDDTIPADTPRNRPFARRRETTRPTRKRLRVVQAAALAAIACAAVLFIPDIILRIQTDHQTGTGETQTVRLNDGSTITLAPESVIAVTFNGNERRVSLVNGEAFFEVTPNPDRPFRVATREVQATVLGTAFNVRKDGEGAAIALQEGRLRVDHRSASPPVSETLQAGDSVRVSWAGDVVRRTGPSSQIGTWRWRQLIAHDQPVEAIVDRLRRYYDGTIIVADRSLTGRSVTGVYNLADPVDALRGIAKAHGATVREITPWLLVVSPW